MRSRIRQAVEEKARQASAGAHWQRRRRELEQLQVGTIHSLCARILRENAIAAGIDPRFDVLDELEADLLKEEAIHETLAELVYEESPALDLLGALQVRDLRREMATLLASRGTVQRLFAQLPDVVTLLAHWRDGLAEMRSAVWQAQLRENPDLSTALRLLPSVPVTDPDDKLTSAVLSAQEGCKLLASGDIVAAVASWSQMNLAGGRHVSWGNKEALAELKEWLKALREAARKLEKAGATKIVGPDDEAAAQALQQWRHLWQRLDDTYSRLKGERQALDFDDLELLAEELLYQEPLSGRLESFLAGIRHLMVDEFQDTNQVQQRIVYALASPEDGGRLFVVGDAKQSIYRFRQAQVSVFNHTAVDIRAATGKPTVSLSQSFRTHESLLTALNQAFDYILRPLGEDYAAYEAQPGSLLAERPAPPRQACAPATVEILLLPDKDHTDEIVSAEDGRIWEAQLLAERLLSLQTEGFKVWDRQDYRPFQFGDAAILFRATTSLPLYEEQFKAAGLPYLTVSGRGYYDRPEVRDLITLLACLYTPGDDLSLATALRSPLFSLSDETLYRLRWHTPTGALAAEPIPFAQALRLPPPTGQPEQVALANQVLLRLWATVGRVDVWRLLRAGLDLTGYEATLTLSDSGQNDGGRQLSNVQKFLALARDQASTSLSDFLRRLRDLQARAAREGEALGRAPEAGAVQLMSIHAAKGLEFPVVAVADLGRKKGGGFGSPLLLHDPAFGLVCMQRDENGDWQQPASYAWASWLHSQMEEAESRRLLYVACTRAADLLLLSGQPGGSDTWLNSLLAAWNVEAAGAKDEVLSYTSFAIRIVRPQVRPAPEAAESRPAASTPGIATTPPLAQPLPLTAQVEKTAVTRLTQHLDREPDEWPEIRPAVQRWPASLEPRRPAPAVVGRIVHRALAEWHCLSLPVPELERRLATYAHREGIVAADAQQQAVAAAYRIVDSLRCASLYQEIEGARQRYSEVPFALDTSLGLIHGVIDCLYQDAIGTWNLVDWKTEWTSEERVTEQVRQHQPQIAIYTRAAGQALGLTPQASLCFLDPQVILYTFQPKELTNLEIGEID
jgi:ATP-dependent helicase/nuclease subunit A